MKKTNLILILLTISSIILFLNAGCKNNKEDEIKNGAPKGLNVEGFVVTPQSFNNTLQASGTLLANEETNLVSEISGRVTGIHFKEGTAVKKGQRLIQLYDADIKAQIQKLRTQKQLQVNTLERQAELLKIGGISTQDYQTTETMIASIDADLAYQEALLTKTKIMAPFDGIIGIRNISEGAVISPATIIASLQQVHPLKMDFSLPDAYRNSIAINQEVQFSLSGSTDTLLGKIMAIDPGANSTTRSIRVRAGIANVKGLLRPGSFAHVTIPFGKDAQALLIPTQAVIPTSREKKVAVVKNGKAELQVVVLGTRTKDKVEVLEGLKEGDTVIITGLMQVKPGVMVKIKATRN